MDNRNQTKCGNNHFQQAARARTESCWGQKSFWGKNFLGGGTKKKVLFSICLTSTHVFLHTLIFLQSCLTGATAESIIQHVSKTPHHISTERKKKKSPVPSPNQFGSWNSAERERLWVNAAATLPSRIAVKLPMLAVRRGGQVLNNQDILSPAPYCWHSWLCLSVYYK